MIAIMQVDASVIQYDQSIAYCLYRCVYTTLVPFACALFGNIKPNDPLLARCNSSLQLLVNQRTAQLSPVIAIHNSYDTNIVCYQDGILVTIVSSHLAWIQYKVTDDKTSNNCLTLDQITL